MVEGPRQSAAEGATVLGMVALAVKQLDILNKTRMESRVSAPVCPPVVSSILPPPHLFSPPRECGSSRQRPVAPA